MDQNNVRWCKYPGEKLLKSVSLTFNGVPFVTWFPCSKCGKMYEVYGKLEENNTCTVCIIKGLQKK